MDVSSNTTTTTSGGGGGGGEGRTGTRARAPRSPSRRARRWTGRGYLFSHNLNLYLDYIFNLRRREKINDKLRVLQKLVPNGTKVDLSTMLEEAVLYVKFLQLRIKNMSYVALFGQLYLEKLLTPGGDPRHHPHHPRCRVRRSTPRRASQAAATAPSTKAACTAHTEIDSTVQSIKEVVGGHLSPTPTDDLPILSR
ncbi:transcription factor PIF3-like [Hordeum vulgare]|nr:transcription factor PIF3-like [Hordeum vulgare]